MQFVKPFRAPFSERRGRDPALLTIAHLIAGVVPPGLVSRPFPWRVGPIVMLLASARTIYVVVAEAPLPGLLPLGGRMLMRVAARQFLPPRIAFALPIPIVIPLRLTMPDGLTAQFHTVGAF